MRKTTLILAFLAIVACGRTQDFLTPESYGIYSSVRYGDETLFRLMFPEDKSDYGVQNVGHKTFFLGAPSFSAEYALEIGKNQLILTKADQSIYMALWRHIQDRKPDPLKVVSVDVKKMSVSKETCERLSTLFNLATMTATHMESKPLGLDGTTYYFNNRRKLASAWEPEYPTVVIDNTRDTAFCEARTYYDRVVRTITLPSRLWRREVILPSVQLPAGSYYFVEGEWRKQ